MELCETKSVMEFSSSVHPLSTHTKRVRFLAKLSETLITGANSHEIGQSRYATPTSPFASSTVTTATFISSQHHLSTRRPCSVPPGRLILGQQASQAEVVHHVLDFLDAVLDAVAALAQTVVLEVQDLEAGKDVFDELGDLRWPAVVAEGDGVAGETGLWSMLVKLVDGKRRGRGGNSVAYQFVDEGDEGLEVLFDGQVEGVAVFEVGRD
jgi:hypothetical protein